MTGSVLPLTLSMAAKTFFVAAAWLLGSLALAPLVGPGAVTLTVIGLAIWVTEKIVRARRDR